MPANRHTLVSERKQKSDADLKAAANVEPTSTTALEPITVLDGGIARAYTLLHPLLVLTLFFSGFQNIVSDPVASLWTGLGPLGILQIVYVVLCVPATGAPASPSAAKATPKGGRGKKPQGKGDGGAASRTVPAMLSHLLSTVAATPVLTVILILFGAPIASQLWDTTLCAAHMTALAVMPLVYTHGVDEERWRAVVSLAHPIDEVFGAALGTMLGAWFGAIPIPLDWDREWQKWPVTIVTGAYVGWALGKVLGATLLRGKRIDLT